MAKPDWSDSGATRDKFIIQPNLFYSVVFRWSSQWKEKMNEVKRFIKFHIWNLKREPSLVTLLFGGEMTVKSRLDLSVQHLSGYPCGCRWKRGYHCPIISDTARIRAYPRIFVSNILYWRGYPWSIISISSRIPIRFRADIRVNSAGFRAKARKGRSGTRIITN